MKAKTYKQVVFFILMIAILILSACGTIQVESEPGVAVIEPAATLTETPLPTPTKVAEVVEAAAPTEETTVSSVEAEATAEPLATIDYSNEENGISFNYPTNWAMEEEANAFVFRNGSVILRVGYRVPGETADLWGRTGMPAGEVLPMDGTVSFLDESMAKYGLFFEDGLKLVFYGGEPGTILQSSDMEFTIILDDPLSDYQTLDIPEEVLAEAETILASFEVEPSQGSPSGELLTYTNPEYGFTLNYPSTWTVAEVNDEAFVGPGSRSVQLSQGTARLIIGYRRASEETMIMGSGAPAGEFEIRGTTQIFGQDVERYVIVYEGKDKVVMYGQPGPPLLSARGLEFAPRLDDFAQVDYGEIELSQSVQNEADMILSSLAFIKLDGGSEIETMDYDYTGWQSYTNEKMGYSLIYPGNADIMGLNHDESVQFVGTLVDKERWPWFTINHFDSDFYRPPAGTDVRQWIADSILPYEPLEQDVTIDGLPTVHYAFEASQQAPSRDEYYVIHGNQLFQITILHQGGLQDWTLYEQFLQSITFTS